MNLIDLIRMAKRWSAVVFLSALIPAVNFTGLPARSAPGGSSLEFAVASMKVTDNPGRHLLTVTNASVVIRRESLVYLLAWSYGIDSFRIIGPDWMQSTFYDIDAMAEGPAPEQDLKAMLRTLLAQRLDLAAHSGTKRVLLVAMAVAKDGLKVNVEPVTSGAFEMAKDGDHVSLRNATFSDLAHFLGADGTHVFDNTGVKGRFNISLNYKPYLDPNDASTHALTAAWQEAASRQIGLRFRDETLNVPVLIVDHARRKPAEN